VKPFFRREIVIEQNEWPSSLVPTLERAKTISRQAKCDISRIRKEPHGEFFIANGDTLSQ
jgi:hypothetical protein